MNLPRWHGPFESANQAALIIALALIALFYVACRPGRFTGLARTAITTLAFIGVFGAAIVLASTQSRAGALAVLGCIALLYWWKACDRWSSVFTALAVLIVMLVWPGGGDRALVAVEDAVRGERPVLASAALAATWDHWSRGLGSQFASTLGAWYLPSNLEGRFATGLNDFLTLAGQRGLPFASLCAGTLVAVLWAAWRQRQDRIICLITALVLVHVICGQFQAHLWYFWTRITFSLCVCALVAAVAWRNREIAQRVLLKTAFVAGVASVLILIAASAGAWFAAGRHPVATRPLAGFPEAFSRSERENQGRLLYVDTVRGAKRFRRGLAARALQDHFSVIVIPTVKDLLVALSESGGPDTLPQVLMGSQDHGVEVWMFVRAQPGATAVILDPTQVPDAMGGKEMAAASPTIKSRVLVVATEYAAFVPERDDLELGLAQDAPGSAVSWVPRDRSDDTVWEAIKTFVKNKNPTTYLTSEP